MGCYWYPSSVCESHIIVNKVSIKAFESAVKECGLLDNFHEFAWKKLDEDTLEYVGDTFVCGDGTSFEPMDTRDYIISWCEPGSFVDMFSDENLTLVRVRPEGLEFGGLTATWPGARYENETALGYPIVERIDQNVVVKRNNDYAVGHLYDEETGTWAWGHYGFATQEEAHICLLEVSLDDARPFGDADDASWLESFTVDVMDFCDAPGRTPLSVRSRIQADGLAAESVIREELSRDKAALSRVCEMCRERLNRAHSCASCVVTCIGNA